jgi:hypothetical protein
MLLVHVSLADGGKANATAGSHATTAKTGVGHASTMKKLFLQVKKQLQLQRVLLELRHNHQRSKATSLIKAFRRR